MIKGYPLLTSLDGSIWFPVLQSGILPFLLYCNT